jgi:hypothetical protein
MGCKSPRICVSDPESNLTASLKGGSRVRQKPEGGVESKERQNDGP